SQEEQIILSWTATGDDEMEGSSSGYEIRYSVTEINDVNWSDAVLVDQDIEPALPGEMESISVNNVPMQIDYHFALKAYDSEGNYSSVSNNVEASIIGDITAPADIMDLSVSDVSPESIMLSWTAVGDNDMEGSAAAYIVKISQTEITEGNWEDIPEYIQSLIPQPAGSAETLNIEDLMPLTTYYCAIKAVDESNNVSNLSNIIYETTIDVPDFTPPAEVNDLVAEADFTSVVLNWTATGDDGYEGTAYQYIIKQSEDMITAANWDDAELLPDPPNPQLSGTLQSYLVEDLLPDTDYYFALKVLDAADNISGISNVAQTVLLQDTTAPATISDLSVHSGNSYSSSTIRIDWTASGDDGMSGTASYCEVRTSNSQITETNWDNSELAVVVTDPESGGSSETLNVNGLENGEVIYFAIKVFDDSGNSSSVSNSVWGKIVYTIYTGPCNGCGNCVPWCPEDAITDHGSWASIDYEDCNGCGTCDNHCPRGAIFRYVINSW
ncbi:fibronectin type III domain-containing protein, partial [Candidatus Cloacimonadota bacterium]